jgi:hypothetical protein
MRKSKFKPEEFEQKPIIPCAHTGCPHPAILSRKLPSGWAKLCKAHDLFHVQQESNEFCRNNGLETYEQKRDWILAKLASPRPTPAEHWQKVLDTPGLIPLTYEMAHNYFKRHSKPATVNPTAFTIPIEDEETEAAFRAYLTETAIPESDRPQE